MSRRACSARSPTPAASSSTGTARRSSTSTRAPSPSTARCTSARSPTRPGSTRCRPTPRHRSAPHDGDAARAVPRAARLAQPGRQALGHQPVRPLRAWATPRSASPTTAAWCASTRSRGLGFAVATDANGRYCQLDPYRGAQLALAEAYRNVAVTGATPVGVSDCLNFGSPREPRGHVAVLPQAVEGLADGCLELEIPVTGGNVSFYNQTGDVPIHPTPVVAVLGVIDDVARRIPSGWQDEGNNIYLLGTTRARARRLGLGRRHPRPPRRTPAGRRPRRARSTLAELHRRGRRAEPHRLRARPRRRRPRARRSPRRCCASASARASGSARSSSATASTPRPRCSPSRPAA